MQIDVMFDELAVAYIEVFFTFFTSLLAELKTMATIQVRVNSNKKNRLVNRYVNIITPKGWKKNDIVEKWIDEETGMTHWKTREDLAKVNFKTTADVQYGVADYTKQNKVTKQYKHTGFVRKTYDPIWIESDKKRREQERKNHLDPRWLKNHKEDMADLREVTRCKSYFTRDANGKLVKNTR